LPSTLRVGCGNPSVVSQARTKQERLKMLRKAGWLGTGLTLAVLSTAASFAIGTGTAHAVVYCKTVGVPKGCVMRPAAAVVAAPVAAAAVATPGVGAPGVGVRPGTPLNRGGPVNRVGRR
jgi:hypothetical protein